MAQNTAPTTSDAQSTTADADIARLKDALALLDSVDLNDLDADNETLGEMVADLKEIEDLAEDSRKIVEESIDVDAGERVGPVTKVEATRRYFDGDFGKVLAEAITHPDVVPSDVFDVNASDLADAQIGNDDDIDTYSYSYFRR